MKPADPLPDRPNAVKDAPEPGPRTPENSKDVRDFEPKYVDVPWQKRRSSGGRNLLVGVLVLIVAIGVFGQAFRLTGARVLTPVVAALLAVLAMFILSRARVLRQRNGGFLAFSVVCLLAALVPFLDYAVDHSLLAVPTSTVQAVPTEKKPAASSNDQAGAQLPQLTAEYQITAPSENAPRFKVLRDLKVEMDGKAYLIKAGEIFPATESDDDEVRFNAGDQQIALRKNLVEMVGANTMPVVAAATSKAQTPVPEATAAGNPLPGSKEPHAPASAPDPSVPETPAQITEWSQKEAIRRYPALGQKNSPENRLFVETFQELKHTGATDFFADPHWPLQLAELLARREKWGLHAGPQTPEPEATKEQEPAGLEEPKPEDLKPEDLKLDEPKPEQPAAELPQDKEAMDDLPSKQ